MARDPRTEPQAASRATTTTPDSTHTADQRRRRSRSSHRARDRAPPLVLWVENLSVSFDGFKALDDVTLTLDKGELRCLIGPNGAGKTTLMDCITGKTRPDAAPSISRPAHTI